MVELVSQLTFVCIIQPPIGGVQNEIKVTRRSSRLRRSILVYPDASGQNPRGFGGLIFREVYYFLLLRGFGRPFVFCDSRGMRNIIHQCPHERTQCKASFSINIDNYIYIYIIINIYIQIDKWHGRYIYSFLFKVDTVKQP